MESGNPRKLKETGTVFLALGIPFLGVAAATQPAFMGVGIAFFTLGIVFLARAKNAKKLEDDQR